MVERMRLTLSNDLIGFSTVPQGRNFINRGFQPPEVVVNPKNPAGMALKNAGKVPSLRDLMRQETLSRGLKPPVNKVSCLRHFAFFAKSFAYFAVKMRLATLLCFAIATPLLALAVETDGAKPGVWTMDYDAAKKESAKNKLPILLYFTGSDWCAWCEYLEIHVFSKPAWKEYAKENLMPVWIDLPKNPKKVHEKYEKRNTELALDHDLIKENYLLLPAFFVYAPDGATQLGKLPTPTRTINPEKFIENIKTLLDTKKDGQKEEGDAKPETEETKVE